MVLFDNKFVDPKPASYGKIGIVIACGLVMTGGGCGLFIATTAARHVSVAAIFGMIFVVGALTTLVGGVILAVRKIVRAVSGTNDE